MRIPATPFPAERRRGARIVPGLILLAVLAGPADAAETVTVRLASDPAGENSQARDAAEAFYRRSESVAGRAIGAVCEGCGTRPSDAAPIDTAALLRPLPGSAPTPRAAFRTRRPEPVRDALLTALIMDP